MTGKQYANLTVVIIYYVVVMIQNLKCNVKSESDSVTIESHAVSLCVVKAQHEILL